MGVPLKNREWIARLNMKGVRLTEKTDWIEVTISQEEIDEAIVIGTYQEDISKEMGLKDNAVDGNRDKSLIRTITSKQAEFAVRRFGGGTARVTRPNEFHDYPDVGQVNVRYVFDPEDGMMIMKRDQGKVPMILVTGESPNFLLMGWMIPDYAKQIIYRINLGRDEPTFGFLHSMEDHEACTYSKQWLMPMSSFNKELLK
jgi:hypothetical protein